MTWDRKYWDIFHRFFWEPSVIGLKKTENFYKREHKIHEAKANFEKREEPLNQFFNITFAIASDAVISKLLVEPLGFHGIGPYQSLDREKFVEYYGWKNEANITEPDGFFTSEHSLVGVELKVGKGRSSPKQLMYYVALMVWEEHRTKRHDHQLGLVLVTPPQDSERVWSQFGLAEPKIDEQFINGLPMLPKNAQLNMAIQKLFDEHTEHFHSVCRRLKLAHVSWQELHEKIRSMMNELDCNDIGKQTLYRLLKGFDNQLIRHPGTGVASSNGGHGSPPRYPR